MGNGLRLVCDRCFAFRVIPDSTLPLALLRDHRRLGPFVREHEDCRPPLRVTGADDPAIELYRERYEEA